jgi:hypothetical protein
MPRDDRDRSFEEALARNLRVNPPAQAAACPDGEVLAAYHERSLAPEHLISWKEHIARCSRCQEVLAQLEATDEIPLGMSREEHQSHNVVAMKQPDLAESAQAAAQAPLDVQPRTVAARRASHRAANWRWLAPAGALAAGLLVWVAVHETPTPPLGVTRKQQQAATPAPSTRPASPVQQPQPEASRGDKTEFAKPERVREAPSKSLQAASSEMADSPKSENKTQDLPPTNGRAVAGLQALAPPLSDGRAAPNRDRSLKERAAPVQPAANEAEIAAQTRAEAKNLQKQDDAFAAAPASPSPAAAPTAVPESSANAVTLEETPKVAASAKRKASSAAAGTPAAQQGPLVVGALSQSAEAPEVLRLARGQSPASVSAPDGKVAWRLGTAGIVEYSSDAGSTWTIQATNVVADLTAGSAPSAKVCWVVGRGGTILRTTDGGTHWSKVPSPVTDDLAAVFAVNAQQASVSTASSHKTYKTMDAGLTWNPLPNQ